MSLADNLIEKGKQEGIQLGKREGIQLGKQEGIQLGKQEGIQIGDQRRAKQIVINMLAAAQSIEFIATVTGLTSEEIKKIEDDNKQ
jgi:predicted transposase YdaD